MFRKMRRFKQELRKAECIEVLEHEVRGVLSVLGTDGYPYGVMMNHWYNPEDGKLYFHGAKEGHKIDAVRANDKVSFVVHDSGYRKDDEWALNIRSVVVFGRMRVVEEREKAKMICTNLCRKFTDDEAYIDDELTHLDRVMCLELVPEHITGKLVKES